MQLDEITQATETKYKTATEKPAQDAKPEASGNLGLDSLKTHYSARKVAMVQAYKIMATLDDTARQTICACLADGSAAPIDADMATFKLRLAKLLSVSQADAATVK